MQQNSKEAWSPVSATDKSTHLRDQMIIMHVIICFIFRLVVSLKAQQFIWKVVNLLVGDCGSECVNTD
jgi:hypothetical protein